MEAQCVTEQMEFEQLSGVVECGVDSLRKDQFGCRRNVLREVEKRREYFIRLACCFGDFRDEDRIERTVGAAKTRCDRIEETIRFG